MFFDRKENSIRQIISALCVSVLILFFSFHSPSLAATLDQLYGNLVQEDDFLFAEQFDFFRQVEDSRHASPNYDNVNSRVELFSYETLLKFAPFNNLETLFSFAQTYPGHYSRSTTHDPGQEIAVQQDYSLKYLRDYTLLLRLRQGPFEPYIHILEKRQKTGWSAISYPPPPNNYFTFILTHYEDFCLGLRYLSRARKEEIGDSGLSLLTRPLLADKQLALDAALSYRRATLRRNVDYYFWAFFVSDNYYQRLQSQYTPGIELNYGLAGDLEFTSGLEFSLPYKYRYKFKRLYPGTEIHLDGTYTSRNDFTIPLELRYRPWQNTEVSFSSDMTYCRQRLSYQRRQTGVATVSEIRKAGYFNTQPSLAMSYFYEGGKDIAQDEFSRLTKTFLSQGQFLLKFKYLRDITSLDKEDGNGALNRIDPYNVFLYPLDLFVGGTEYAAAFTGNKSDTATNVAAQNYNLFQFSFIYGFTDRLNAGFSIGHRTSSRLHHFTLGSSSLFDLISRYYVIKPYWFFSVPCDWRLNENSLLSLVWYYVPEYRTEIDIEGVAKDFRYKTDYHSVSLALKILF